MDKPLILFIQWFGPWPEWIEFFIESCKWNPEIDWLIFTDQDPPLNEAPNVRYRQTTFDEQKARLGACSGLDLSFAKPMKLCDFKPLLGLAFSGETKGYRNYGHCDIDLIFGSIRSFHTDDVLAKYEVLSTHADRISGHLAVLRNNDFNKQAYRRIKGWRRKVLDAHSHSIDEYRFGNVFRRPAPWRRLTERRIPILFEERHTTPLTKVPWLDGTANFPARWYWQAGRLTAEGYEGREFIYLHFMNWKATTTRTVRGGHASAPWSRLERVVGMDWRKAGAEGFMISHDGIGPLPQDHAGSSSVSLAAAL